MTSAASAASAGIVFADLPMVCFQWLTGILACIGSIGTRSSLPMKAKSLILKHRQIGSIGTPKGVGRRSADAPAFHPKGARTFCSGDRRRWDRLGDQHRRG